MTTRASTDTEPSATASTTPLLLTIDGAASLLAISRRSIYKLISARTLPVVRIGRSIRVARTDIELLISDLRTTPTAHVINAPGMSTDASRPTSARRSPTALPANWPLPERLAATHARRTRSRKPDQSQRASTGTPPSQGFAPPTLSVTASGS